MPVIPANLEAAGGVHPARRGHTSSSKNAEGRQDLSPLGDGVVSLLFTQGLASTGSGSRSDTNIIISITTII